MREWHRRPENRHKAAVWSKCYRTANAEKHDAAVTRWEIAHPDRVREYKRRWSRKNYVQNIETERVKARQRYAQNPEKACAITRAWQRRNPFRVKLIEAIRRAREADAFVQEVTTEHLQLLLEAQDGKCRYCKEPLTKKHLEHRIPLSRGGTHQPSNVCWSCPSCNQRKYNKTEAEFLSLVA